MLKFAPYLLKTLWRHRTRTLLTVSGSAVALFVFSFVLTVQQGLQRLTQQDDSVLIVFQANKFCPATSHLPQDYTHIIEDIPGVREVVPIQVFTNNCRASLDVVVFYGTLADKVRQVRDFVLVDGDWADFEGHQEHQRGKGEIDDDQRHVGGAVQGEDRRVGGGEDGDQERHGVDDGEAALHGARIGARAGIEEGRERPEPGEERRLAPG